MADKFVEVTERGWLSRIVGSVMVVPIGLILFLAAFVVLWSNEGRVDVSKVAAQSVPIEASAVDPAAEGKLVAVTGVLESSEQLGDTGYLEPGNYIELNRDVEMFAWVEHTESETKKKVGGGETTTTEYTYATEWTSSPRQPSSFKVAEGHANPPLSIEDASFTVQSAQVGAYSIDPQHISLPAAKALSLTEDDVIPAEDRRVEGSYIYIGRGTMQQAQVGDVRIQYTAVPGGIRVTAFGKQEGDRITLFQGRGTTLYRAYAGDRESAIAAMASAHKTTGWLCRGVGFLMMWIGLTMALGPISTFLDVLPFLGGLSRGVIGVITFMIAAVLSLVVIVISAIVHSIIALVILLVIVVTVVAFFVYRYMAAKKQAAT